MLIFYFEKHILFIIFVNCIFWQRFCILKPNLKLVFKYSLFFVLAFASLSFQQQQCFDPNNKLKAIFIYNFTRYFEWPEKMKTGNFVIHIIGTNHGIYQELNKMAESKAVGNQKLEIRSGTSVDPSIKPHIIFLLTDASDMLKNVASQYKGKGTLVITEKPGLAKTGSSINFVIADSKQKFEYNKKNAEKCGLKTNEELKSLAIVVD